MIFTAYFLFVSFFPFVSSLNKVLVYRIKDDDDNESENSPILSDEIKNSEQIDNTQEVLQSDLDTSYQSPLVSNSPILNSNVPDQPSEQTEVPKPEETNVPEQTEVPKPDETDIRIPEATEVPKPEATEISVPEETEIQVPDATEVPKPEETEIPVPEQTEVPKPEETEIPKPEETEIPVPEQTEIPKPEATEVPKPEETEIPKPEETEIPVPEQTEIPKPEATEVPIPEETEIPKPEATEVPIPEETEIPKPEETEIPVPEQTDVPEATEMPEQTDVPKETEMPEQTDVPEATEIPEQTDVPKETEIPEPVIDESEEIYVCEGSSCDSCGESDEEDHEIQLKSFDLLDELLSRNNQPKLEIEICGSSREHHPHISMSRIENKFIEFKGKKGQQYITFVNDSQATETEQFIKFESEEVTIIVDESVEKQTFSINSAQLEKSPIEVENLVLKEIESDLVSLASVRNNIYCESSTISDDSIKKLLIGNDYITFNPTKSHKSNKKSKDDDTTQVTLHAVSADQPMDILVYLEQNRIDFTSAPNLDKIDGIKSIIIDLKNDDDKATIVFDGTWNNVTNMDLFLIKHECNLDIVSESDDVAKKISVVGDGSVSRNGQIDGGSAPEPKKKNYINIIIICLVAVVVVLIAVALFIILRKKCKKRSSAMQNYNEYLNNSEELDPINMVV